MNPGQGKPICTMPAFRDALPNVRCAKQCLQIPGTVILHKAAGYKPATQVDISSLFNNNLQTAKWRRRESNEQPAERNHIAQQDVTNSREGVSGYCQELVCTRCHNLALLDARLRDVIATWSSLDENRRQAIMIIVSH
jgi:hypothetical protein